MQSIEYARDAIGHGCFAIDLDGNVQSFDESIRDALIARGELTCIDGVWHVKTHGVLDMLHHAAWLACCDFCNHRPVCWNVGCTSFTIGDGRSEADWVACDPCGSLVKAGDEKGLLQHVIAQRSLTYDVQPFRQTVLRELHRQFWKHHTGMVTAIPIHPYGH